ncbi:winged helix-turn-helix transcriptional regulator [Micromonospora pisi]|uniref:winged helix-turn-helix transcriptional regulator n=1 Tax=Micromonospora pisi TaxID=589240 RepID=UPI003CCC620F
MTRSAHPEVPPRVEYALTPLGRPLSETQLRMRCPACFTPCMNDARSSGQRPR